MASDFPEFINLLEEITNLNDHLLPLYLSKYFYDHLQDVPEPRWINTSAPEFDPIFTLNKTSKANEASKLK